MPDEDARLDLRALLDAVENARPSGGVGALAAELATRVGASRVHLLVADIGGDLLARVVQAPPGRAARRDRAAADLVRIEGSAAGRALRRQQVELVAEDDGVWVYAPVTDRGEAVGVMELLLPAPPDEPTLAYLASAGHALAYVVIADRRYTDLYEWTERSTALSLAAEIQRRLLPSSYACEAGMFSLAGWMIPAHDAGGDTFDYAVDDDTLHLSLTDAMGHGVAAAQLATLAVGSLRNNRRRQVGLVEQARAVNAALAEHARPDQFVTGLLLRVDLVTGAADVVNAGHVRPLLVRDGQVSEIPLAADLVFGLLPDVAYRAQRLNLEPGDRLVLLTDGMLERNAVDAAVPRLLVDLVDEHPREVVQTLARAVLEATAGQLRDDATVLVLDWYDGPDERSATAGASDNHASR